MSPCPNQVCPLCKDVKTLFKIVKHKYKYNRFTWWACMGCIKTHKLTVRL
jgi:hypothetical protein